MTDARPTSTPGDAAPHPDPAPPTRRRAHLLRVGAAIGTAPNAAGTAVRAGSAVAFVAAITAGAGTEQRRRRVLRVEVDASGAVARCDVVHSSGYDLLDRAAADAVRRWRYAGGPGTTDVSVAFVLR